MSSFDSYREHHRRKAKRSPHRPNPIEGPYNKRTNNLIGAIIFIGILTLIGLHLWGVA